MPPEAARRLTPAQFSFTGFEGLMPAVAEAVGELTIRGGDPAATVVENAVYLPAAKIPALDRTPGRFAHEGGLVTRDGEPVQAAQSQRHGTRWGTRTLGDVSRVGAVAPQAEIAEEVIYLGWYFRKYGHFLTETLSRTWFLDQADPTTKVVFHTMREARPEGITARILTEFGLPPERILIPEVPTRLRRVIVPEPLYELATSGHEWMPRPFREVAARVVGDVQPSEQPLYLSRRLLPSHLRQLIGEFELEEVLRENGVHIAYPETLPFAEQVRLVNQHRHLLTSAGSAAYNALFARHPPTLHLLTAGLPRQDYFLLPAVLAAPAAFCNCLRDGGRPAITKTPLLVETPPLISHLAEHGLLRKRLRADLTAANPLPRQQFDEAWLYAMVRDARQGQALPADLEAEAMTHAATSWPLSLVLARYFADREPNRVDALARQFTSLAAAEADVARLAHYHDAVTGMATRIAKACRPGTAAAFRAVLATRFLTELPTPPGRGDRQPGHLDPAANTPALAEASSSAAHTPCHSELARNLGRPKQNAEIPPASG
jgi:hypothetical protein